MQAAGLMMAHWLRRCTGLGSASAAVWRRPASASWHTPARLLPGQANSLRTRAALLSSGPVGIGSIDVGTVAQRLTSDDARYLDCRSEEEFAQGTVPSSVNIPFPHTGGQAVEPADFLADVEAEFQRSDTIMLGCRSGVRSLLAAEVLTGAGFTDVSNVEGGFIAWQAAGLPIEPFTG